MNIFLSVPPYPQLKITQNNDVFLSRHIYYILFTDKMRKSKDEVLGQMSQNIFKSFNFTSSQRNAD